jgi:hypothetical protein
MSSNPSLVEKIRGNFGKWVLGIISVVTTLISFVNLLRGNYKLAVTIVVFLMLGNALLFCLYVIFHKTPSPVFPDRTIYPYLKYRKWAALGVIAVAALAVSLLVMQPTRGFVEIAVLGTHTPTPTRTPTPPPPEVTMLVTTTEGYACDMSSFVVSQKMILDVGVNNNSKRDLFITAATLKPLWIYASQWMGPTSISATYNVSLDEWWGEVMGLQNALYMTPAMESAELERTARVGYMTWAHPHPIEVKEILEDKFTVKKESQDRFQIELGLSETYQFMWGKVVLEIKTDNGMTLVSEPIEIAVCYEESAIANYQTQSPASEPEPLYLNPASERANANWVAWNNLAKQDSGGVVVEVSRLVLTDHTQGLDYYDSWMSGPAMGEIFFTIQNNTDSEILLIPGEMEMSFNSDSPAFSLMLYGGVPIGQPLDGFLAPGETRVGGYRFETYELPFAEIRMLRMYLGCAFNMETGCSGPDFLFKIDLSNRLQEAIPEFLLQKFLPLNITPTPSG